MSLKKSQIKAYVRRFYQKLYDGSYRCSAPIERGRDLALKLGYPPAAVSTIPDDLWDHFVPCGNPLSAAPLEGFTGRGLNLGSGAGIDAVVLLQGVNPPASIINLDPVATILKRAQIRLAPSTAGSGSILWCCGDGEHLPFRHHTFHWVLLNGVCNLFADKRGLFCEIARVLHECGRLFIYDLFLNGPVPSYFLDEPDAWAWNMNGAQAPEEVEKQLISCGFTQCRFTPLETEDLFTRGSMTAVRTSPVAR